ncbi:24270_t:CDS:1, partial [Cetraspora pellucida]
KSKMERQKQAAERRSKKKKKKKVEKISQVEEYERVDKNKKKTEPIAVTSIQAKDFLLISKYLGRILTTQELDRLKKVHNLYVELEANGALSKMKNSIEAQYGPISISTLKFERRLE